MVCDNLYAVSLVLQYVGCSETVADGGHDLRTVVGQLGCRGLAPHTVIVGEGGEGIEGRCAVFVDISDIEIESADLVSQTACDILRGVVDVV